MSSEVCKGALTVKKTISFIALSDADLSSTGLFSLSTGGMLQPNAEPNRLKSRARSGVAYP